MNTRFDLNAYNTSHRKCRTCGNPAVKPEGGDRLYCVRCNMTMPEFLLTGRGR